MFWQMFFLDSASLHMITCFGNRSAEVFKHSTSDGESSEMRNNMYAIVETGAKQYRVEVGTEFSVEKLRGEVGDSVTLDKVLLIKSDEETLIGTPYIEGAGVKATIVAQGKAPKVIIFKYLAKKDSRKKKGHRQPFTLLRVEAIEQA